MQHTSIRHMALLAIFAGTLAQPCLADVETLQEYKARTAPRKPSETQAQYEERSRSKTKMAMPVGKASKADSDKAMTTFMSQFKGAHVETLDEYNARTKQKKP
ncbi:MAG TPA: hypothetical protein VLC92_01105 [Rhodocyclaceae bacterium]|nr:hypothetical protein [Rhodocyclaceae bacterium]